MDHRKIHEAGLAIPENMDGEGDLQSQRGAFPLYAMLRRHWKLGLLILLLTVLPAVAVVMMRVKPEYKATAQIQVEPLVQAILYQDDTSQRPLPFFDAHLNTEAQRIQSQMVLTAALADPNIQSLAIHDNPRPVNQLQAILSVEPIRRTHLIQVAVTHQDREVAMKLAKAIVDAYMVRIVRAEQGAEANRRDALEKERERLLTELESQTNNISEASMDYKTADDATFITLRENQEKSASEISLRLLQVEQEEFQLNQQLENIERGQLLPTSPQQSVEQLVEEDYRVRSLRQRIGEIYSRLATLQSRLSDSHYEVITTKESAETLEKELEAQMARAEMEAGERIQKQQTAMLESERMRLQAALAQAAATKKMLRTRWLALKNECDRIGASKMKIERQKEQRDLTKENYHRVLQELKKMDIESRRQSRISLASGPEIRPTGVIDKRRKALAGCLALSVMLAAGVVFLRDKLDRRVQDTQQIEESIGLPLLGVVPSIRDLRAGKISHQDFVESYRILRTTLIQFNRNGCPVKSILITSAQGGEGKTSLAISLAVSLAETGDRVLLVDGDLQAPDIARVLHLEPPSTLRDILTGERALVDCVTPSSVAGLDVLAAKVNGQSAHGVLDSRSARQLVGDAGELYDHVILDSPPSLGAADSLVWATAVDGVIISSLLGGSKRPAIQVACQRLQNVGARLLGAVVSNVPLTERYFSYSSTSCSEPPAGSTAQNRLQQTKPVVCLPSESLSEGHDDSV